MEEQFPRDAHLNIIVRTSSPRTICEVALIVKNETQLEDAKSGYPTSRVISNGRGTFTVNRDSVSLTCPLASYLVLADLITATQFLIPLAHYISMLKRSPSMEFESSQYKSPPTQQQQQQSERSADSSPDNNDDVVATAQSNKKMCHSPDRATSYDESDDGRWKARYGRYSQSGSDNSHVTQSKSIFSHENSCVYGNPKEELKSIENPDTSKEVPHFEASPSVNALDLSCKPVRHGDEDSKPTDGNTYHNYQKGVDSIGRSNLQIKIVNPPQPQPPPQLPPAVKKPSIPEQLQIAKIQQQQRRSIQQQQKLIQQMRRSLDPTSKPPRSDSHKKFFGNSAPSSVGERSEQQQQSEGEYPGRIKDEYPPIPGAHYPGYPYFEPGQQHKELPDGHPILPLLDPVYFSALYNAHGFLPPSSPSIAAAFIGTLQDALPKLPLMFPSTSSNNLPQKSNDNHN